MRPFQRAKLFQRVEPVQREDARRRRIGRDDVGLVGRQTDARIYQHPNVDANDHGYAAQVQVHEIDALHGQRLDWIVHDLHETDGEHENDQHHPVKRAERHPKMMAENGKHNQFIT